MIYLHSHHIFSLIITAHTEGGKSKTAALKRGGFLE